MFPVNTGNSTEYCSEKKEKIEHIKDQNGELVEIRHYYSSSSNTDSASLRLKLTRKNNEIHEEEYGQNSVSGNGIHKLIRVTDERFLVAEGVRTKFFPGTKIVWKRFNSYRFRNLNVVIYDRDGNKEIEATLRNNKLNGEHIAYHPNGNRKTVSYCIDGMKNGICSEYYPNEVLKSRSNMIDGFHDGFSQIFYPSGSIEATGNFRNGKKNGIFIHYMDTGSVDCCKLFSNGIEQERIDIDNVFNHLSKKTKFDLNDTNL